MKLTVIHTNHGEVLLLGLVATVAEHPSDPVFPLLEEEVHLFRGT
jgi:hypothetical protein